jgi:hypothetical protein
MKSPIILRPKPQEFLAIQWTNNEVYIREFVQDDMVLRFPNGRFEVWNSEQQSWINVPMWHYIYKGARGEMNVISPETMEKSFTAVTTEDIPAEVIDIPSNSAGDETIKD